MTDMSGADNEFRSMVSYAPSPVYPYAARAQRLVGSGVVDLDIDRQSGRVKSARIEKSTGHKILDSAALTAYKQWRFNPRKMQQNYEQAALRLGGTRPPPSDVWKLKIPITFTMPGGAFATPIRVHSVSGGPDAIAIYAPGPKFPPGPVWTRHRSNNGVAIVELDAKTGTVTKAYMNPSTGHTAVDELALTAFRQWRFKPGTGGKFKIPVTYDE